MCVCVCVCVYVIERDRESMCVCVCVCVCEGHRGVIHVLFLGTVAHFLARQLLSNK